MAVFIIRLYVHLVWRNALGKVEEASLMSLGDIFIKKPFDHQGDKTRNFVSYCFYTSIDGRYHI